MILLILASHPTRATIYHTLNMTFGALVFHGDMFLPIQILNDWNLIRNCKQSTIDKSNQCQNARHIQYDYQVGQQVHILADSKKLSKL